MRYSIFSVNDHHPRLPRTVAQLYQQVMAQCELAEALGYDTFFCAEHQMPLVSGTSTRGRTCGSAR